MRYTLLWCLLTLLVGFCRARKRYSAEDVQDSPPFEKYSFNRKELELYKEETKELFYFAHDNYLTKGYPYDELRPISCTPKTRNFADPDDQITNDVLGNFSVTLVDSLSTVAVIGDRDRFGSMVRLVEETFPNKFDIDSTVQVFETTIRIVGGLISAHLYATDASKAVYLGDEYNGCLLELARDMADRLLPAYLTLTGLPVPRINLRSRFDPITIESVYENNVAAMASPTFEFTMLSYLTNDSKYAQVTRYALDKTWSMRSELQLLSMSFNPQTGQCYSQISGIGASIDSFYEYALKGAILFDDEGLFKIWQDAYSALNTNSRADWFYTNVQSNSGQLQMTWVDSLSAFFPGLQVLAGDVEDAMLKHLLTSKLWDTFGGIPERWDFRGSPALDGKDHLTARELKLLVPLEWYPLRPEYVESTYFLYRATKDPFYLNIGVAILESLQTRFKHECGFGGYQDVTTGEPQDRMETFILSETLKYLYLLFDIDNELHRARQNVVFSTEAHPMWLTPQMIRNYKSNKYFNDTTYRKHLHGCRVRDGGTVFNGDRPSFMGSKLIGFAKSFFVSEQDNKEAAVSAYIDSTAEATVSLQNFPHEQMCYPVEPQSDEPQWLHSRILSQFDRLFEIDRRYSSMLIKPDHMMHEVPAILRPGFYDRWAERGAFSRPAPTTESFEIVLDLPGESQLVRDPGGSIHRDKLGGRSKIRLEKIEIGHIDTYGRYVDPTIFVNVRRRDIQRPDCDKIDSMYSPKMLYRATMINGIYLPPDAALTLNQRTVFTSQREEQSFRNWFGHNIDHQLMLDCVPIINFYLQ